MKKMLLLFTLILAANSLKSAQTPSWHEARKAIVKKAETVTRSYDHQILMWTSKIYEFILSQEYTTEAWQVAQKVIEEVIPKLPVYKKVMEHPHDDIYFQELVLQGSMFAGQVAGQLKENYDFVAKVSAIVSCYFEVLRETIRK